MADDTPSEEFAHPDGLVTRVDAHNSPGYGEEQTLVEPLLEPQQQRDIALDPVRRRVIPGR